MKTSSLSYTRRHWSPGLAALAFLLWITFGRDGVAEAGPIKVACVGDSITAGDQASSPAHVYPAVLGTLAGPGWDVRNFGNSGKTMIKMPSDGASYWDQVEFKQSQTFLPDIVVLMLGTNDAKTANWMNGNNTYEADYRAMVAVYQGLSSHPQVFAMLPPPAILSTFTISGSVIQNQIIPIIRSIAASTGIGVIDINAVISNNQPSTLLSPDGIHPNDAGYKLIAQTVWAAIRGFADDAGVADAASPADARASDGAVIRSGDATVDRPADGGENDGGSATAIADASPPVEGGTMPSAQEAGQTAAGEGGATASADSGLVNAGSPLGADSGAPGSNTGVASGPSSTGGCSCSTAPRDDGVPGSLLLAIAGIALRAVRPRTRASRT